MKTVVGLYDDMTDAQRAVQALVDAGIDRDQISLVARDSDGRYGSTGMREAGDEVGDATIGGAATGAAVGGAPGLARRAERDRARTKREDLRECLGG